MPSTDSVPGDLSHREAVVQRPASSRMPAVLVTGAGDGLGRCVGALRRCAIRQDALTRSAADCMEKHTPKSSANSGAPVTQLVQRRRHDRIRVADSGDPPPAIYPMDLNRRRPRGLRGALGRCIAQAYGRSFDGIAACRAPPFPGSRRSRIDLPARPGDSCARRGPKTSTSSTTARRTSRASRLVTTAGLAPAPTVPRRGGSIVFVARRRLRRRARCANQGYWGATRRRRVVTIMDRVPARPDPPEGGRSRRHADVSSAQGPRAPRSYCSPRGDRTALRRRELPSPAVHAAAAGLAPLAHLEPGDGCPVHAVDRGFLVTTACLPLLQTVPTQR